MTGLWSQSRSNIQLDRVSITHSLMMDFTVKETICMLCIFWNVWWGRGKSCHFKIFMLYLSLFLQNVRCKFQNLYLRLNACYIMFAQTGLQQYCFLVFLAICCSVAIYIVLVIPETKNKTFLEIQNEFQSSKKSSASDGVRSTLLSTSV